MQVAPGRPNPAEDEAMSDEHDPTPRERLDDDPIDRMEPDQGDEQDVERAWEQSDPEEGEAPTG